MAGLEAGTGVDDMRLGLRISLGMVALALAFGAEALNVGPGGQASYAMPISVPPGVAGMQPNLALSYADGGINGPLGVGWGLQGISAITRCPSSKVIDGTLGIKKRPTVRFDADDRLCLDGQRLIALDSSGNPDVASDGNVNGIAQGSNPAYREYRTEKDSFARIRAYGMAAPGGQTQPDPSAGPAYFKVWTKAGQVYEYGLNADEISGKQGYLASKARINAQGISKVAVWALSRVSDALGNYADFKYEVRELAWGSGATASGALGQEWNLVEIQYTGNSARGLTPQNKVIFQYEDRSMTALPADVSEAYQVTSKNISVRRLKAIRTYINSSNVGSLGRAQGASVLVRAWYLDYNKKADGSADASITGRSRLTSIKECVDELGMSCRPATRFTYNNGTAPNYVLSTGFASSPLAVKPLIMVGGWVGTLTGDFNGDGKTDILYWSNNPAENEMYFSTGNGGFQKQGNFSLKTSGDRLFAQDSSCYSSIVADFNGDSRSDILRIVKPGCTNEGPSKVYLSKGDGDFTTVNVPSDISFDQRNSKVTSTNGTVCQAPASGTTQPGSPTATVGGTCTQTTIATGTRYYLIDVNGDGLPDIVTTKFPGFVSDGSMPMPAKSKRCSEPYLFDGSASQAIVCTRIFLSQGDGRFVEDRPGAHPNQYDSLFQDLPVALPGTNPYWRALTEADMDGDGLQDVASKYSGQWRNKGDGSFERASATELGWDCASPIDFNGDQRADCLRPDAVPANQSLTVNASSSSVKVARFNLTGASDALFALDSNNAQTIGFLTEDIDGDGRQDLMRWSMNTADNGIYLSNGDGSFRARVGAGLDLTSEPLVSLDGKRSFITGDFLGTGSLQFLQLRDDAAPGGTYSRGGGYPAKPNVLLALSGDRSPIDHLQRVTLGNGIVLNVDQREPLTTSASYQSDRGTANAATGKQVDLQFASWVITQTTKSTPGYGDVSTRYSYHGFKAEREGRGMLGFRENRQLGKAPNGDDLTVVTRNLLQYPYTGTAGVTETYLGSFLGATAPSGQPLSRTTYSYCDTTSSDSPTAISIGGVSPASCATTSKIQRPYLYQSLEEGRDLKGKDLPKVRTTNVYNNWGDPTSIVVRTSGVLEATGAMQEFVKTVTNTYKTPTIDDSTWILGRLDTASVNQTAPNALPGISLSVGQLPKAGDRDGTASPALPVEITLGAIAFGQVDTSLPKAVKTQLRNGGSAPLTLASIGIDPIGPFSILSKTCSLTTPLAAGAQCDIEVQLAPTKPGTVSASLVVKTSSGGERRAALSGEGTGTPLTIVVDHIGPAATDNVFPAYSSPMIAVYYRNSGTAAIKLTAVDAGPTAWYALSGMGTCQLNVDIPAGGKCYVLYGWNAAAPGFSQTTTKASFGSQSVTQSLSATHKTLDVAIGNNNPSTAGTADITIKLSNNTPGRFQFGASKLNLKTPTGKGSWAVQTDACPTELLQGAECTMTVRYTSGDAGAGNVTAAAFGRFTTQDFTDGNNWFTSWYRPDFFEVTSSTLTANSVSGVVVDHVNPAASSSLFPAYSSPMLAVYYRNYSTSAVKLSGVTSTTGWYSFSGTGACQVGVDLPAGQSCYVLYGWNGGPAPANTITTATFGAQAVTQSLSATLQTLDVNVSNNGASTASTADLAVKLSNNTPARFQFAGSKLNLKSVTGVGTWAIQTDACPAELAAGADCTITVRYTSSGAGAGGVTAAAYGRFATQDFFDGNSWANSWFRADLFEVTSTALNATGLPAISVDHVSPASSGTLFPAYSAPTLAVYYRNNSALPVKHVGVAVDNGWSSYSGVGACQAGVDLPAGQSCYVLYGWYGGPATPSMNTSATFGSQTLNQSLSATLKTLDVELTNNAASTVSTADIQVKLTNNTPARFQFSGAKLNLKSATGVGNWAIQTDACPAELAAGGNCTITVRYTAAGAGAGGVTALAFGRFATQDFIDGATWATSWYRTDLFDVTSTALSATGLPPISVHHVSPAASGTLFPAYSAPTLAVYYRNNSALPVKHVGVAVDNGWSSYSGAGACQAGVDLPAGQSCYVLYGWYGGPATPSMNTNATFGSQVVPQSLSATLKTLDVSLTNNGASTAGTADIFVKLTNNTPARFEFSGSKLNLKSATGSGSWTIQGDTCPAQLAAGANCTITVRYSSAGVGTGGVTAAAYGRFATQDFIDGNSWANSWFRTDLFEVTSSALSATGLPPISVDHVGPAASGNQFPAYSSPMLAVYYRNNSSAPVRLNNVSTTSGWVSYSGAGACQLGTDLAGGQACYVLYGWNGGPATPSMNTNVTFGSQVVPQSLSATLKTLDVAIANNNPSTAGAADIPVTLSNNTPARFEFAGSKLNLKSASGPGTWAIQSDGCPAQLAAGSNCTITVRYTAAGAGSSSVTAAAYGRFATQDFIDGNSWANSWFRPDLFEVTSSTLGATGQLPISVHHVNPAVSGNVLPAYSSPMLAVYYRNNSTQPIRHTGVTVSSGWTTYSGGGSCQAGVDLPAGQTCYVLYGWNGGPATPSMNTNATFGSQVVPQSLSATLKTLDVAIANNNPSTAGAADIPVTLSNNTPARFEFAGSKLNLKSASGPGTWAIQSDGCPAQLAAGSNCTITVRYTAAGAGSSSVTAAAYGRFATQDFIDGNSWANSWFRPDLFEVTSSTLGATGQLPISVDHVNPAASGNVLPAYSSPMLAVYYRNNSTQPIRHTGVTVSSGWTTYSGGGSCQAGVDLPAGQTCYVLYGWSTGPMPQSMNTNATFGSQVVPQSLTATLKTLDVSVPNNNPSTSSSADLSVVLSNNTPARFQFGASKLNLKTPSGQGSWVVQGDNCPAELQPGGSCTVTVRYLAGASGSGNVTAAANGRFATQDFIDGNGWANSWYRPDYFEVTSNGLSASRP